MTKPLTDQFVLGANELPIDIGAVVRFNGFTFNDRLTVREVARLTAIDGLMDAEIKDSRGDNPSDDGDVAYEAHPGPRTVTLTGSMEAGNLQAIVKMKTALGAATNDLAEHPLVFSRYDVLDTVSSEEFTRYWLGLQTPNDLAISGGKLIKAVQDASSANAYRKVQQYSDGRATIRLSAPSATVTSANVTLSLMSRLQPPTPTTGDYAGAYLIFAVGSSTGTMGIAYGDGTTTTSTNGPTFSWSNSQTLWLRLTTMDNDLTAELFASDPFGNLAATPLATQTLNIPAGANRTATGAGVMGYYGAMFAGNSPQAASVGVDDFRIEGYRPCDVMFQLARKGQSLGGTEQQAGYAVKRPFQVSFRCSDPRLVSVPEYSSSVTVTATNVLGRVFDRTFDVAYSSYLDAAGAPVAAAQLLSADNRGNYKSLPRIRMYGYLRNPSLFNQLTGKTLRLVGEIPDNDYVDIDFSRRTAVDSQGNNRLAIIDPSSDVFTVAAGVNVIQVGADAFGGVQTNAAKVLIYYRSAWL
jgi:hypothetical protein